MSEISGFFDAHLVNGEYDRVYLSESFAKYFANFVGSGVFGGKAGELLVRQKETADMSVRIQEGKGFINGYFYENTDELSLNIDGADGVLNRIDLIVLRWDKNERRISIVAEKGTPAASPSAPALKRNDDFYDLCLARVSIKAGATRIGQADITDTRLSPDVCGIVVSTIEQLGATATTESAEYPGCYYRIVNGSAEWLNPPAEAGIEYRLAERFKGKPVYQTLVHIPSLPNASTAIITTNFNFGEIVSVEGSMVDASALATSGYPFPVYMVNSAAPVAIIHGVSTGLTGNNIYVSTSRDLTGYKANVIVKYVK